MLHNNCMNGTLAGFACRQKYINKLVCVSDDSI